MKNREIRTTLEEDFQSLGIPGFDTEEQAILSGGLLSEDEDDKKPKGEELGEEGSAGSVDEDVNPLDAEEVNHELFDAIMALPIEDLQAEQIQEVIDALEEKKLPRDEEGNILDEELGKRAEEVVDHLLEAVAVRKRRAKSGSMAKKASFQCPEGTRRVAGTRRCVRAAKAAGGAGKLAKEKRKKARWSKSGKGKLSSRKSARWAARREGEEEQMSEFALELSSLLESQDVVSEETSLRDEIVGRIGNVFEMLHEEFMDEAVTRIFEENYEPLVAGLEAGRLDETVMGADEFLAEVKPVLTLITKSLDRVFGNGDSGN